MKQFNVDEYNRLKAEGKEPKIVTRDGRDVRILCTDRDNEDYPVIVLIQDDRIYEDIWTYTKDGKFNKYGGDSTVDLFFAPVKHEGWVNIYAYESGSRCSSGTIFSSKESAEENKYEEYVATVKVEWEE